MPNNLITVATFNTPAEAGMVRNLLESEGVRASLSDEVTVAMCWYLGTALHGIKLQVAEGDVGRALEILQADGPASMAEGVRLLDAAGGSSPTPAGEAVATSQDEAVARAFRAAVLGLILFPLQLYTLWLLARIAMGSARLTAASRWMVTLALLLAVPPVLSLLGIVLDDAFRLGDMFNRTELLGTEDPTAEGDW